jgi:hypothetical protein
MRPGQPSRYQSPGREAREIAVAELRAVGRSLDGERHDPEVRVVKHRVALDFRPLNIP